MATAAMVWVLAAVFGAPAQPDPLPPGRVEIQAILITDTIAGRHGPYALAESDGVVVLLDLGEDIDLVVGETVLVEGVATGRVGRARGSWHSSAIRVRRLERLAPPEAPHLAVGNAVRGRVMEQLAPFDDGRALLAGFLIGDTSEMDPSDEEAMRLAGLSHFVAVSGSNVALFLGLLFLAAGPLALGPRRRALVGLVGLPAYTAATRFERSVMRASLMAGIALAGRLVGIALETWQLLSVAVVGLLVTDPSLASSVGFQLSVAATAGVLVGGRWPTVGGKVARGLLVTLGAQIAVAPLLLMHFGTVPVFSPLANLVAAPLGSGATPAAAASVAPDTRGAATRFASGENTGTVPKCMSNRGATGCLSPSTWHPRWPGWSSTWREEPRSGPRPPRARCSWAEPCFSWRRGSVGRGCRSRWVVPPWSSSWRLEAPRISRTVVPWSWTSARETPS